VLAAARYAGYSKAHELASAVEDTARNLDEGKRVTGWPRLAELLDPKVTRRLQEWLGAATAAEVKATSTLDKPELRFPQRAMIGSLGAFAEVMAAGTEVPEEFYFAAALTLFGNACAKRLRVNANVACEPRLYTVLLGESYDVKKSTALHRTTDFFRQLWTDPPAFSYGVGSAEGLAKTMVDNPSTVICYDELRAFLDKTKVTGSVLLPMVTSLFEMTMYQNRTKKEFLNIEDGHLSLVSCCTLATYESMWTPESLGIGLLNRLFVVVADRKPKVAWPDPPEPEKVEAVRNQLARQMQRLPLPPQPPLAFNITPEAKQRWQEWYENLPISLHARRLDTIGFRLMSILTHTSDKQTVDLEVIEAVAAILDYELRVRKLTDPVDADNVVAKLEERIRNILETHGGMYERQLKHLGNYKRYGTWLFMKALNNLTEAGEVRRTLVERGNRNSFFYSLADQMVS
jgi:hypothetical protein